MRILFMGTPDFAVASLSALVEAGHQVCGVFCQPDKPVGRHQNQFQAPPVKEYALARDIPVYQPVKLRDGSALALVRELDPQLIVVAAYGRILPQEILDEPPLGCINVHSSLLPRYRGAAPINWAILNGDDETGVTIQQMVYDLDAGDILSQERTPIDPDETAPQLFDRLARMGGRLLVETIAQIEAGTIARTPQDESQMTVAPMLSKELSPLDFDRTARQLHDQVRGLLPWPAATAVIGGLRCKILKTRPEEAADLRHGMVLEADKNGLLVACTGGSLRILELQPDGKKPMAAAAFLAGHPVPAGTVLEWK